MTQEQHATKEQTAKIPHPLHKLCQFQKTIVIQQKGGCLITGRCKWFRNGFLKLTEAHITGRQNETDVPWILIDHNSISHLHPDGNDLTLVSIENPAAEQ